MHVAAEDTMNDDEEPQKAVETKRSIPSLSTLEKLSDTNEKTRILAGEALLKDLSNKRSIKDEEGFRTTLECLVKGLSSRQRSSRVGYTATLIQILQTFPDVPAEEVIGIINKHLALDVKEDRSSVIIGRTLAFSAIIRAGSAKAVHAEIAHDLVDIVSRSPCTEILVCEIFKELLSQVKKKSFQRKVWPALESTLSKGWDNCSPFELFLLCSVVQKYPETVGPEFLKEHWNSSDILSKKNVQRITAVLQSSLSTLPHIHPVCRSILEYALSNGTLAEAWKRVYSEGFLQSPTHEKMYIVMDLLPWCVSHLPSGEEVESIFTEELKKLLLPAVTITTHILYSKGLQMIQRLVSCAKETEDAAVQIALLGFFVKKPSSILFDQVTKSSTVKQLLANASSACVLWYRDFLKTFLKETTVEGVSDFGLQQSHAFEQLSHLLTLPSVQPLVELRAENLCFLAEMYASLLSGKQAAKMQSAKKHLQSAILKALVPSKKIQATEFIQLLVSLLTNIKEHGKMGSSRVIEKSLKLIKKMEKGERNDTVTSFQVLLGYLSVLVVLDIFEDNSILEDIRRAATGYLKDKSGKNENETDCIEVIMETLLNMLSMAGQAHRSVTALVFSLISNHMTDDALQHLLSAFGTQKEEEEVEFDVNNNESSDSESSGSELEEDETAEANSDLKERLKAVLGGGEDSDEEVVLTDKEMFELDEAISAAFKARIGESKKDKLVGIQFQLKCLELLQEYVGSSPPLHHLVNIGGVLVAASTLPNLRSESTVINSISDTLLLISAVRKFSGLSDLREEIAALTKDVLDQTSKVSNLQLRIALGTFSAFLVLCYKKVHAHLGLKEDCSSWYLQLYMDSFKTYLEQSSHISPLLFVKFMETLPEHCYDFIVALEEKASACMEKQHLRFKVFGLLVAAIRLLQGSVLQGREKSKIKNVFKSLTDIVTKALGEMAKNRTVKMGMAMEFADLLLVISKQSSALGFQHPFENMKALAADLETLTEVMGPKKKILRKKVGQVLKEINKTTMAEKTQKSGKRKHQGRDEASSTKKSGRSE